MDADSGTLEKTIVSEHCSSLNLQVQLKKCKDNVIYEKHLKTLLASHFQICEGTINAQRHIGEG